MKAIRIALFALAFASSIHSLVVSAEESVDDHSLILLVGPAVEKNIADGSKAYGTSLAFEFTAIENQLEIEMGTQYLSTSNPKELGAQIIFKKPFELAKDIELGIGLGTAIWRKTSSPSNNLQSGVAFAHDPLRRARLRARLFGANLSSQSPTMWWRSCAMPFRWRGP